jgi:hypothetical protein
MIRVEKETGGARPRQWHRNVDNNEFVLEQSLDGDVVVTYHASPYRSYSNYKKLPCDGDVVTGRSHFDHEYFDTTVRPVLEHAGYQVDVPEYEPEEKDSLLSRIKSFITR